MKTTLSLLCFCCIFIAHSQSGDTIIVRKDGRLDLLTTIQAKLNKKAARMTYNGLYHGYRLQLLSTQSREQAFDLKAKLLQRFPDQKAYTIYQSPYFKVRFGNFIDRSEAERYKRILTSMYPQIIYVINDNIEYTPKDDDITSD